MTNSTDVRCTSLSEDGRRCHGDVGHPGTHWAAASRVWSDAETLVRPPTTQALAAFLLARIAEDEAAARAASGGTVAPWSVRSVDTSIGGDPAAVVDVNGWAIARATTLAEHAEHIARHDPARVLAECETKRRIVELHEIIVEERDGFWASGAPAPPWLEPLCMICGPSGTFTTDPTAGCETLALLALPYADHPDFRPEWRA